ncbi:MAG TPA: YicC/YloC family endoribonuclease [Longimicrobiales bacterium]
MIRSMTGYGEAELEVAGGRLRAQVKTVNHRYFSAHVRLPRALERYDPQVREWLRGYLPRGHVDYSLRVETGAGNGEAGGLRLDEARARQYIEVLRALKARFDLPGEVDVALVSRFGEIIVPVDEEEVDAGVTAEDLRAVTEAAAQAVVAMREVEGERLRADIEERLNAIEAAMAVIEERAPARLVAERDRLRRAIAELAAGVPMDEERLAREVAYLAERWDISEELVRLRSHIQVFRETLATEAKEPVGKRLGFLTQELHREANTIGSKANDAAIEHQVVAIKNEIERIREQVENIE